jgi:uncharacterized membrane protein YeaQ/YmgE (transglycosylase-associated protein family)
MNVLGLVVTVVVAAFIGRLVAGKCDGETRGYAMVAAVLGALVLDSLFTLWPRPWNWDVVTILVGAIAGSWLCAALVRGGLRRT